MCRRAAKAGTHLSCATPPVDVCGLNCDDRFPSKKNDVPNCGTSVTTGKLKKSCQTNCGCCDPGTDLSCESGTYEYNYVSTATEDDGSGVWRAVDPKSCESAGDAYVSTSTNVFNRYPPPPNKPRDPNNKCVWYFHRKTDTWRLTGCNMTSVCKRCSCCVPADPSNVIFPTC